jgi:hypothetical protein
MPPKTKQLQAIARKKEIDKHKSEKNSANLADKTFGLKNKKGKKQQAFIKDATHAFKGAEINKAAKAKAQKKKKVEDKKAADLEMKRMYGEMTNVARNKKTGKRMTRNEIAEEKKREEAVAEEKKRREEFWANLSLEEKIEHKRAQLDTSQCTPVTAATFAAWRQAKIDKKMAAEQKILASQKTDKRKGKQKGAGGGSTISGKSLFALDASLFKDDAAAVAEEDILAMPEPEEEVDSDKDSDSDSDSDSDTDSDDDDGKKGGAKVEVKKVRWVIFG